MVHFAGRFMSLTFMAKCAGMMGTAVTAAYQVCGGTRRIQKRTPVILTNVFNPNTKQSCED